MRYYFCELFYHLSVKNLQEKSSLPSYVTSTRLPKAVRKTDGFFLRLGKPSREQRGD